MTPLPPDLEALMPEPGAMISLNGGAAVRLPYFTADQVRETMQAATERAAKLAATLAYDAAIKYAGGYVVDFEDIAAAIRGGGKGS